MMRPAFSGFVGNGCNPTTCGRKHCTHCGRWRPLMDFPLRRREPMLVNHACRVCLHRAYEIRRQDPAWLKRRQASQRVRELRRRRKAGQLPRARFLEAQAQSKQIVLGRKFCTRCGRWRPVHDYRLRADGVTLYGQCRACVRTTQRDGYARRREDPEWLERRREYERIYHEAKRREAGIEARVWVHGRPYPDASTKWVTDAEPIRELVRDWPGTISALAKRAGVSDRLLVRLRNEGGNVTVAAADRIALAAGLHLDLLSEGAGL